MKNKGLRNIFLLGFFLYSLNLNAERVRLITPDHGLSNSHITQIYQDSKGYIWIATENGLNRYDGYDFEVFLSVPNDGTSIQGNFVTNVYEDSRGLFWVATTNGLQLYDQTRNVFSPWESNNADLSFTNRRAGRIFEDRNKNLWVSFPGEGIVRIDAETLFGVSFDSQTIGIGNATIICIFEDRHGNLWFGTENEGIIVLNPNDRTTKRYTNISGDPANINSNRIFSIIATDSGEIWIGTLGGGVFVFDEQTQSFRALETSNDDIENMVYSMLLDDSGTVWVGTDGAGIYKYAADGSKTAFWDEIALNYDLSKAKVHSLFQDKQGNIWVALFQKGVLFISTSGNYFQNIGFNPFNVHRSIGTHCIISILEDSNGNVWVGADGDALYRIDPSGNVEHITSRNTRGFHGNVITALYEDRDGYIWIGTYINGFFRYNPQTGQFDTHFSDPVYNHVTSLAQDADGNLWIATNGSGILVLNPKTNRFHKQYLYHWDSSRDQISSNWIFDIIIDRQQRVWTATSNGLNMLNAEKDIFEAVTADAGEIVSNMMYALLEDQDGNIWVGTYHGLLFIDKTTGIQRLYTTADGLSDNMITGIQESSDGALWISTGKGLCRFQPQTKNFTVFFAEDGIQSNEFRRGSHFKGRSGRMYFGGINGITTFYPSDVSLENPLLKLVFTNLYVNNELVRVGHSDILSEALDETSAIRLRYSQRNFTLMFAALEFAMPQRVDYFVMMENFETQWRHINNNSRYATFMNMSPGNYVLKVQATIDGRHILQKDLQVIILRPWWFSIPAQIAYSILILLLLYGIYVYLSYRQLERHQKELEHKVEERTRELVFAKEKAEESDNLKSAFLANMSHEIRTPLNCITGFLQFIDSENIEPLRRKEFIKMINNSSAQLTKIINDIVDISKIEAKQMNITIVNTDLNKLMLELQTFYDAYLQINYKPSVSIILDDSEFIAPCMVQIDSLRLKQILNNLINNAIKFTEKGYIRFGYRESAPGILEFFVEDTGIGLKSDQLEIIFERFRQAELNNDYNCKYGGTGLGLSISRSLAQLMGGNMRVESTQDVGSTFYFTIKYDIGEV